MSVPRGGQHKNYRPDPQKRIREKMAGRAPVPKDQYRRTSEADSLPEDTEEDGVLVSLSDHGLYIFLGVLLLTFTVVPVVLVLKWDEGRKKRVTIEGVEPVSKVVSKEPLQDERDWQKEMKRVLQTSSSWWNARTEKEMLKWVRDPERVAGMLKDYREIGGEVSQDPCEEDGMVTFSKDSSLPVASTVMLDGKKALLVELDGEWKVDMEATYQVSEIPLDQLRWAPEVERVLVRCQLQLAQNYSQQFPLEDYLVVSLDAVPPTESVRAYVRRGSDAESAIRKAMGLDSVLYPPAKTIPATVRVSRVGGGRKDEFEIVDWVRSGWVSP